MKITRKYYAVRAGHSVGIYTDWKTCKRQVDGFKGNDYKSFKTIEEAESYLLSTPSNTTQSNTSQGTQTIPLPPPSSSLSASAGHCSYHQTINCVTARQFSSTTVSNISTKIDQPPKRISNQCTKPSSEYIHVFVDGACSKNGSVDAKAGIGVYFGDDDPRNVSRPLTDVAGERPSNNRAELESMIAALNSIPDASNVVIYSDSNYVLQGSTEWIHKWKPNGWRTSSKGKVQNIDLWSQLESKITSRSGETVLKYVPGHSHIPGNEKADLLARQGISS